MSGQYFVRVSFQLDRNPRGKLFTLEKLNKPAVVTVSSESGFFQFTFLLAVSRDFLTNLTHVNRLIQYAMTSYFSYFLSWLRQSLYC